MQKQLAYDDYGEFALFIGAWFAVFGGIVCYFIGDAAVTDGDGKVVGFVMMTGAVALFVAAFTIRGEAFRKALAALEEKEVTPEEDTMA